MKDLRNVAHALAILSFFFMSTQSTTAFATPIYVDKDAPTNNGTHDGSTWALAYYTLQDALAAVQPNGEVWVADGTYYPFEYQPNDPPPPRESTFVIPRGVKVYGGFLGNSNPNGPETVLGRRNPEVNLTILSGDLIRNDGNYAQFPDNSNNLYSDNAYRVVTIGQTNVSTKLSGFVIRGGYADGTDPAGFAVSGGGLYLPLEHDSALDVGPLLDRLVVEYCFAKGQGGGMALSSKEAITPVVDCRFQHNHTAGDATAVSNYGGGGIYTKSTNLWLQNCVFWDNHAENGDGGGLLLSHLNNPAASNIVIANCTFFGNVTDNPLSGGGAIGEVETPVYSYDILNTIAWGDTQPEIAPQSGSIQANISYCDIENGVNCTIPNICTDPLFVAPSTGDLRLRGASGAVNRGNDGLVQNDWTDVHDFVDSTTTMPWDVAKLQRVMTTVDMGAHEHCLGDFDFSGVVDISDLAFLLGCFGFPSCGLPNANCCLADFDGNGVIELQDLAFFLPNFGINCKAVNGLTIGGGEGGENSMMSGGFDPLTDWLRSATAEEVLEWWFAGPPPVGGNNQ